MWKSARDRERASLLVSLLLASLTIVSLMFSTGVEMVSRLCWLAGFVVMIWSQVSSILDRTTQTAITAQLVDELPQEPVILRDYAGADYVHVPGAGWVKWGPSGG